MLQVWAGTSITVARVLACRCAPGRSCIGGRRPPRSGARIPADRHSQNRAGIGHSGRMRPEDVQRAETALAEVQHDIAQLRPTPEGFAVEVIDGLIRVTRGANFVGWIEPESVDDVQLLVDVADAVQDLVSYGEGDPVWPVCGTHNFGLHPEVHDGVAVWMCRPHDHVVSPVGRLA
jgi:hypothetical protein